MSATVTVVSFGNGRTNGEPFHPPPLHHLLWRPLDSRVKCSGSPGCGGWGDGESWISSPTRVDGRRLPFSKLMCVFSFVTKREPEKSRLAAARAVAQAGSTILLGDGTGDNPQVPPDPTLTPLELKQDRRSLPPLPGPRPCGRLTPKL